MIQVVTFLSPIVGGHLTPWKGHVFTIPKRSRLESPGPWSFQTFGKRLPEIQGLTSAWPCPSWPCPSWPWCLCLGLEFTPPAPAAPGDEARPRQRISLPNRGRLPRVSKVFFFFGTRDTEACEKWRLSLGLVKLFWFYGITQLWNNSIQSITFPRKCPIFECLKWSFPLPKTTDNCFISNGYIHHFPFHTMFYWP